MAKPDRVTGSELLSQMALHSIASLKSATQKKGPAFPYLEKKVAEKLHLSRKDFRYVRRETCEKHRDYSNAGRELVLAQGGLDKILEFLQGSGSAQLPADFADCLQATPRKKEDPPPAGVVELKVLRKYGNPRMMLALDHAGEQVIVNVPDSKNFVPGMTLRARQVAEKPPRRFRLEGRCPRFKGRY